MESCDGHVGGRSWLYHDTLQEICVNNHGHMGDCLGRRNRFPARSSPSGRGVRSFQHSYTRLDGRVIRNRPCEEPVCRRLDLEPVHPMPNALPGCSRTFTRNRGPVAGLLVAPVSHQLQRNIEDKAENPWTLQSNIPYEGSRCNSLDLPSTARIKWRH